MVKKTKSKWKCTECGTVLPQYMGKCPHCGQFETIIEVSESSDGSSAGLKIKTGANSGYVMKSKAWTVDELGVEEAPRTSTGVSELDRILDGGLIPGQVVLIGAEPGFGKSTLCLEVLSSMAKRGLKALYASGEESANQIGDRARRLGVSSSNLMILGTTVVEEVLAHAADMQADVVCVDSLQAMASEEIEGGLGGVSQSKEASFAFRQYAKDNGVPFLLVSQFTKSDEVAGSNQIPHAVDTILVGESDKDSPLKFLRSRKNRNGRTGLTAVFIHEDDGVKSVSDPSKYLAGDVDSTLAGSARTIINDGGRLLPVEVDALCAPAAYGSPQRQFNGVQAPRGKLLTARLQVSSPELELDKMDVFVGMVDSVRAADPSSDLAIAAAIAGSALDQASSEPTVWVGEVSLTGQIRGRSMIEERAAEAARLGFKRIVCSSAAASAISAKTRKRIEVIPVKMLDEVLHLI